MLISESTSTSRPSQCLGMDNELLKKIQESGDQTLKLFLNFVARFTELEDLTATGKRLLPVLNQELETLRRPSLKPSDLVNEIIDANLTDRMKSYVEAGWKHTHADVLKMHKLHSCMEGLGDHINKVRAQVDELGRLKEKAIYIAHYLDQSISDHMHSKLVLQLLSSEEADEPAESAHLNDKSLVRAALMAAIYNMLRLDFEMQERIVRSLSFDTLPSELEGYCAMWDLRPYVDDQIMLQALKLVPKSTW